MPENSIVMIIPAYNASATVARAVTSALREPEVSEIIVVDDGSTDDTVAAAMSVADNSKRLKVICLHNNYGPSIARNRAIAISTAPWIGLLDADDFIMPGRFKPMLELAKIADFIADNLWQVPEGNIGYLTTSLFGDRIAKPQPVSFAEFVMSNITRTKHVRGELGFVKPIIRRRFLDNTQLRYQETLRLGEDYDFYARAIAMGARFYLTPSKGYVSVMRHDSLSGKHSIEDLQRLRDCDESLAALPGLNEQDRDALREHYLNTDCRLQWRLLIEAVRGRKVKEGLATFQRRNPVPLYLLTKLAQELVSRTGRRIGRMFGA